MSKRIIEVHTDNKNIDGQNIKAEYLEFNVDHISNSKSTIWKRISFMYHQTLAKIRDVYWEIRYGFQRMFKGYDSVDCFETYAKFTDRYYKILTRYKKNHCSFPEGMTEKEWDNIIDEMLKHLYYMDKHNVEKELSKGMPKNWRPSGSTVYVIMDKHKDEFFKLFSEYFYNLWD